MKRRVVIGLSVVLMAFLALAGIAWAHEGQGSVTCTAAAFQFSGFPTTGNNTVTEVVKQDGVVIYSQPFTFTGSSGSNTVPLSVNGQHTLQASASWTVDNGGSFTGNIVYVDCETRTVTTTVPTTVTTATTVPVTVTNNVPGPTTTVTNTVTAPPVTVTTTAPAQTVTAPGTTRTVTVVHTKVKTRIVKKPCTCPPGWRKRHGICQPPPTPPVTG